jgi:hypothetical protein
MQIAVLGIDLGKNSCSIVELDDGGAVVLRRRMRREGVIKLAVNAAASCRTCSFVRLAAPLGRPAPGRFPPCPFIVLSRRDRPMHRHSGHL